MVETNITKSEFHSFVTIILIIFLFNFPAFGDNNTESRSRLLGFGFGFSSSKVTDAKFIPGLFDGIDFGDEKGKTIGIYIDEKLNNRFSFQVGLSYVEKGGEFIYKSDLGLSEYIRFSINSLELPASFKIRISPSSLRSYHFDLLIGVFLAYNFDVCVTWSEMNISGEGEWVKRIEPGMILGLSNEIKFGPGFAVVDLRLTHGIISFQGRKDNFHLYNNCFLVSFGYKFTI